MKTTKYQHAKMELLSISVNAKNMFKGDKPAIRQSINDGADSLCKSLDLTELQRDWLSSYACKLHPKN